MSVSDRSMAIANNFVKYIKTGDKAVIEPYTLEELKRVKYEYSRDSRKEFYKAIEDRIKKIEAIRERKENKKEKWLDRLIGFIIGVVSALIIAWLVKYLKLGK